MQRSLEGIPKGYVFCQNNIQKAKVLDNKVEPLRVNLCRVHLKKIGSLTFRALALRRSESGTKG